MEHKETGINFKKIQWNLVLPVIHIAISWIYELFFLKLQEDQLGVLTPAFSSPISYQAEQTMMYVISKLFGCILIFVIWQIIFDLFRRKKLTPFFLLLGGLVLLLLYFPYNWALEVDNLTMYSQAIRYHPDYWHSILTGCIYNACLMVCYHGFFIPYIQTAFFLGALYYLSEKLRQHYGKKAAWLPYLCFLFPETYWIMVSSYRNCIYAIFCIWFFSLFAFDLIEKRKYTPLRFVIMGGITLMLTILRTEGIFFFLLFVIILIWQMKGEIKKQAVCGMGFVLLALLLNLPQKLGEAKYFGNDYMIANYINILCSCFHDENVNLSYEGAGEDLAAIEVIVPVEVIEDNGLMSYYEYNLSVHESVNQSFATKEEQQAFLKAGMRIMFHNLPDVVGNRLRYFAEANGVSGMNFEFTHLPSDDIQNFLAARSTFSINEMIDRKRAPLLYEVAVNQVKAVMFWRFYNALDKWDDFLRNLNILLISRILVICLLILTVVNFMKKREIKEAAVSLLLLLTWGIIIVFSPEAREVYYYPVFYSSLIWSAVFLGRDAVAASKESGTEDSSEE